MPTVELGELQAPPTPASLPAQIVERFVCRLTTDGAVSNAGARALEALLAERASLSRDVVLRAVRDAVASSAADGAGARSTATPEGAGRA